MFTDIISPFAPFDSSDCHIPNGSLQYIDLFTSNMLEHIFNLHSPTSLPLCSLNIPLTAALIRALLFLALIVYQLTRTSTILNLILLHLISFRRSLMTMTSDDDSNDPRRKENSEQSRTGAKT